MLKTKTQTPAFSSSVQAQESLRSTTKTPTDLEQVMSLCADSDYVITIDGGGSKTLLQVIDTNDMSVAELDIDGGVTKEIIVGPTNVNIVGFDEARKNLEELIKALSKAKVGPNKLDFIKVEKKSVVCGLAGILSNVDKKAPIIAMFEPIGVKDHQIYLGGDVDLAKLLIGEEGAILIAGTGSICFSKSAGVEKRIGGYGWALGDEGSGFYIGKLALQAALDDEFQHDVTPFVLTDKLCELLNIASINEAIKQFYNGTIKPPAIAKITPFVFEAAFKLNDPKCKAIIEQAAGELAKHIACAVDGGSKPAFSIYLIGGIFKNENAPAFIEMIRQQVLYAPCLEFVNIAEENIAMRVILNQAKVAQTQRLEFV
jgi:N-acetylglucosamine kinase-like BadF-type ATPase